MELDYFCYSGNKENEDLGDIFDFFLEIICEFVGLFLGIFGDLIGKY